MKIPAYMTAGEINRELDRLRKAMSRLNDALIAAGRGHETFQETMRLGDPLSLRVQDVAERESALQVEIHMRAGPGVSRLPTTRGYGPRMRLDKGVKAK